MEVRVRVASGATRSRGMVLGRWAVLRHARAPHVGARASPTRSAASTSTPGRRPASARLVPAAGAADAPHRRLVGLALGVVRGGGRVAAARRCAAGLRSRPSAAASCSTSRRTRRWSTAASSPSTAAAARPGARRPRRRWCSATTAGCPPPRPTRWVGPRPDPWVDEVPAATYDAAYEGTGNWPFNTAYAASRGLHAFVTRLRSLREAEALVAAGIPVIASVSFSSGALYRRPDLRPPPATCWWSSASPPAATSSSTTRPPDPRRPPHLQPRPVRVGLARRFGRHGLRHPRRRPPAARRRPGTGDPPTVLRSSRSDDGLAGGRDRRR